MFVKFLFKQNEGTPVFDKIAIITNPPGALKLELDCNRAKRLNAFFMNQSK
jgi:hypothetical protein